MSIIEKAAVWYLERKNWIVLPGSWIGMLIGGGSAHSIETFEVGKPSVWTVTLPAGSPDMVSFLYAVNHAVIDGRGTPYTLSVIGGRYPNIAVTGASTADNVGFSDGTAERAL